jgi:hypothetical protein
MLRSAIRMRPGQPPEPTPANPLGVRSGFDPPDATEAARDVQGVSEDRPRGTADQGAGRDEDPDLIDREGLPPISRGFMTEYD